MKENIPTIIEEATGATGIHSKEHIQTLWSGYGEIIRYGLTGGRYNSVVVKHVSLPTRNNHPRGWNTGLSHQRKLKSYQVEIEWYRNWAGKCDSTCYVPECLLLESEGDEIVMVLEDLNDVGFPLRKTEVSFKEIEACLKWLANFHAIFLDKEPVGLWPVGTYWHLDTRPDELEALDDKGLKSAARKIDHILNDTSFKTIVHGDAKLANFCFSNDGQNVAAVDFQYVGRGCGMKDVAYFIGSCLYEDECEKLESQLLNLYFNFLKEAIRIHKVKVDFNSLESNWRELFPVAWTDFHRFIKGWSPGHWKINSYSEKLAKQVVDKLNSGYEFNK